ncbi:MAG: hypothetical protein RLZZ177_1417 [Pseudomonadota bacterium]
MDPGSLPGVTGFFVIQNLIREPAEFHCPLQVQLAPEDGPVNARTQGGSKTF